MLGHGGDPRTALQDCANFAVRGRRGEHRGKAPSEQGVHATWHTSWRSGQRCLGCAYRRSLIEAGYVADHAQAFARYIGEGCAAYVDKFKMQPTMAVSSIHGAGGLAFIAHPGYYMEDFEAFLRLLDAGFDGVEVFHPYHIPPVITRLLALARDRGLLISGGSDFHGFAGRDNMGEPAVSHALFERIQETLIERRGTR